MNLVSMVNPLFTGDPDNYTKKRGKQPVRPAAEYGAPALGPQWLLELQQHEKDYPPASL